MIIGFAGYKRSCKSEATRVMLARGYRELKMADPLKDMLRTLYRYSRYSVDEVEERIEGSLKEVEDSFLGNTPRVAMQQLGTEWRDAINTNLWSDIWYRRVRELTQRFGTNVVCSDIRFKHEIERIHELGGRVYWINRTSERSDSHVSETNIAALCDGTIWNTGTLESFREQIQKL